MSYSQRTVRAVGVLVACVILIAADAFGQTKPAKIEIPANTTVLEGVPTVRVDAAEASAKRHVLGPAEAAKDRLRVKVIDGKLLWASQGDRPLRLSSSGDFTHLTSDPGSYIRLTKVNNKITYVEHIDQATKSVTWWGELRFVVGK